MKFGTNKNQKYFAWSLGVICAICICDMAYHYIRLHKYNQSPLNIETFDGSNSPYHPSVLYSSDGWGEYHYIMSETPFYFGLPSVGENYRDQYEDPSIHFSKDGLHWTKCTEPLVKLSKEEIDNRDYYSDPDLVWGPNGLECWYRMNRRYGTETNQDNIVLYRSILNKELYWSKPELIADLEHGDFCKSLGRTVISQTLLYEDGKYKMWYHSGGGFKNGVLEYSETDTTLNTWTKSKRLVLKGPKISPWHQHIMKDGKIYWLTIYDHQKNITIWKSIDGISFDFACMPIQHSGIIGSYYSHDLYRACLIKLPNKLYRLYFSADDGFKSSIGVMEGLSPASLKIISIDDKKYCSFGNFVSMYFCTRYDYVQNKISYYTKRILQILFD